MNILFCDNPLDNKTVDLDYFDEWQTANEMGFTTHLFSFESLTKENDAALATRKIKRSEVLQTIIYRGWMLKANQYELLYTTLLSKNYKLINSLEEYLNCHYLPDSYKFIEKYTPKTIWFKAEANQFDYEILFNTIKKDFGVSPLIIKDFVKSQKHHWHTACFIPTAQDREKVKSVISKFIELQGDDFNEGLVVREFLELEDLTIHSKSGMPLTMEYRLFYYQQQLIGCYDYWEEGEYSATEKPPLDVFNKVAASVDNNFFSMDIAKTKKGEWVIIELGDGQVAGLPEKADKIQFYQNLKAKSLRK